MMPTYRILNNTPITDELFRLSFEKEIDFNSVERLDVEVRGGLGPIFYTWEAGVYPIEPSTQPSDSSYFIRLYPKDLNIPEQCTLVLTHYLDYSDSLQVWTMGLPYVDCS